MTGEELGIKLLKMLAAVQSGKATKGVSTAEITRKSNELTKPEYDDFYYMTQIGNLITNLSKQAKSYNYAFFRWFLGIELSLEEIIRAEKTLERNKNMDATDLLTFKNFYNVPENIEGIKCNYALCHQAVRGLMAVNSLIAILMKAYHLPFMKCYMFDMTELQEKLAYFNNLVDKLEKYTASQNTINCFRKIDLNEWRLDPEMLKLTEKVAILSHLDSLILTWCSNYEVILNNLMEFELFDNPDWQLAYMRPDGTKYGNFKYPERDGKNKWGINVIEKECIGRAEHNKDDIYFITPKKSHPLFTFYAVYVNEKVGLYKIRAVSDFIACNDYGTELKNAFENFKDRISKTYGEPEIYNRIDRGSHMEDDRYWMMALQDGARELYAVWGGDSDLQDNLICISLQCKALNDISHYGDGLLILDYDFKNTSSVQDEQDSVF